MSKRVIAIAFVLSLLFSPLAISGPLEEAGSLFEEFLTLFTNADVEGIVELFSKDALFWGTGSQSLVQDKEGIRQYFSGLSNRSPGQVVASAINYSVLVLSEDHVVISGMWQSARSGQSPGTLLRVSLAASKMNGRWQIVQFHNSRVPE